MKTFGILTLAPLVIVAVAGAVGNFLAPRSDDTTDCGDLGIMEVPDVLPEGVTAADVRKCAGHPLGKSRPGVQVEGSDGSNIGQACWTGSPYGCTNGTCWKVCGPNGEWCWTANAGGLGSWITCSAYQDCGTTDACGIGGPKGGCSC